ncbi:MAG: general glycosylation pathway protein [Campylobacter sp.]|nr:general glycosylation pathway protein [Campylobacter sp.]
MHFFENFHLSKQKTLLILMAFMFSVGARFLWVDWAYDIGDIFINNGVLMINTNDGYAFAEGARDMLAGFHQENDLSYYGNPLSTLTYWIVKYMGIKLEFVMLYLSVFLSSLICVGVLLIAFEYNQAKAGFAAALLAGVANSYYNRTMAGYFDTDMLTVVIPVFIVWGLIRVLERKNPFDIIIAPLFVLLYNWWYTSGFSLVSLTTLLFGLYTLVFDRKNSLNYLTLALMLIGIASLNFYLKILLILAVYFYVIYSKNKLNIKISFALLFVSFLLFTIMGGLNPIWFQLKFYIFRDSAELANTSFRYFNVNQTIQESSMIDLQIFCERISSSVIVFICSLVGLGFFCYKYKSFIVSFGMLALGFMALKGGLRFTIYAVPIMAMGFGYFVYILLNFFKLKNGFFSAIYALIVLGALYPSIMHIKQYQVTTVFYANEVENLEKIKKIADREDYVLAWWDYGYGLRYYSDVKTLIDGGKHLGRDNYAVSFALFKDQNASANMARLEVEYTQRNFKEKFGTNLNQMIKEYGSNSLDEFLILLNDKNFKTPPKTREIYYYLPERMLDIFPTIVQFSNLDLNTGKKYSDPFFIVFSDEYIKKHIISFSDDHKTITINGEEIELDGYFESRYDENEKLQITSNFYDMTSGFYVIYMRDQGKYLLLDKNMLNSTFIQLYVLENYDKELFEPVILDRAAKIYRLKK